MPYHSIVLIKQVPDIQAVTGNAIKPDGTLNRSLLPAIFNPEDLHALEMALMIKDEYGGTVRVITMGPLSAVEILKESLYRGADACVLVTDKNFAGSDTWATSLILKTAINKLGHYDFIVCGRQAIDGDTAQVGPQIAEKLKLPQVTYTEQILELKEKVITVRRRIRDDFEIVRSKIPVLITVLSTANIPRPPQARKILKFKKAVALSDKEVSKEGLERFKEKGLLINKWGIEDLSLSKDRCGISGSPTRVIKTEKVVLKGVEIKKIEPMQEAINFLFHELHREHTFD
ncbi:MAG: electron transfer flavoprotein subunit beta/FixA family protein [Thermodesulfobacteriota bacterium]|nr:electron transfer flavoprotein subunit beta/FixA family protein [Thermodesulfobacteriota bacterium]